MVEIIAIQIFRLSSLSPVDKAKFVYRLQGEGSLGHVELRRLLCQGVLLHQERHHVTFR